jgi:hypothetical protein
MLFAPSELGVVSEDFLDLLLCAIKVGEGDRLRKDKDLGVASEALEDSDLEDGLPQGVHDLEDLRGLEVNAASGHLSLHRGCYT